MITWNVSGNRAQNKETCNKKRGGIQLITAGCPSHHRKNSQRDCPSIKINHYCGADQHQQNPDTTHGQAQV